MAAPKHSDTPQPSGLRQRAACLPGDLARTKARRPSQAPIPEAEDPGGTGEASLSDFAATLSPLLDEAEERWAHVTALFERAERACGPAPDGEPGDTDDLAWRERQRVAQIDTGYSAAWNAVQPLFERIDALVGPFMATPAQTLEALVLKRRIGFVFDHFEEDAIDDLDRLARAGTGAAEEPVTTEEAAGIAFGAHAFDLPWRDPRAWSETFAAQAIGMHIADKTLRMTKSEMVAFIAAAGGSDDELPGILFKALDVAQETFEGWGKLLATARARYLVAGSAAVIADAAHRGEA